MPKKCICGNEFEPKRASAKYCSPKCRVSASRAVSEAGYVDVDQVKIPADVKVESTPPSKNPLKDIADATGSSIDSSRLERLNARLRAKGLPLIETNPVPDRFVPTGIEELDSLTRGLDIDGVGGLPRKKITEIFGPKGSSKTSLIKQILKHNPKLKVLMFDAEGGMLAPPEGLDVVKGNVVEEVMPALIDMVEEQEYDLIVLDSVASLVTRKQFDEDPEGIASMARVFGPQVKRLVAFLQPLVEGLPDPRPGTAVLFINQYRDTTQSFGKREYTIGGRALEYYSSLRMEFRSAKADAIIRNKAVAGKWIRVKVDKSRYGPEGTEFRFPLWFEEMKEYNDNYLDRFKDLI